MGTLSHSRSVAGITCSVGLRRTFGPSSVMIHLRSGVCRTSRASSSSHTSAASASFRGAT
eukprot:9051867-Alexandrium_andersonii.AAC.1